MDNQQLFGQTYNQIVKDVLGGGTKYFQMLGNPQSFNWPVSPVGQIAPAAYQLMSAAPVYSAVGVFGGVGTSTLFNNYKQIFAHVGFNQSAEAQQQLVELSNQATEASNNIASTWATANSAYNVAKQNGGAIFAAQYPDFNAWMSGPGMSYVSQADMYQQQLDNINAQQRALNSAHMPTSLQEAQDLMKIPGGSPADGNAPRGWTTVLNQAGVLEWQPVFNISTTSQDWRKQLTNGSIGEKTIRLDASKTNDSISKSWAGGNTSYSNWFWGVKGSGGWEQTNITQSDNTVTATITLKSATNVLVTPGAWYDGGFLKQLATAGNKGTGYQILSPYTAKGDHALFGKDGLCSTMVTGLVVAYQPSFSVTMQSRTFSSFERQINASTGFRIGPFSFGGSGGHYEKNVSTTGNSTTFSGGSTSTDPVIIGVTVGFPGVESP